jgi:copper chaperone
VRWGAPLILQQIKTYSMKTIELKTNIMCGSCVAKATPVLNEAVGEGNWKVDTQSPKKVLTVSTDGLSEADVVKAVEKAGFTAEALQ